MRGRKAKIYEVNVIMDIINQYLEAESNPFLKIEYRPIYEFASNLFKSNRLDSSITDELSSDFWRKKERQGRILVDEVNRRTLLKTVNKENEFSVASTKKVIEQYSQDKVSIKKQIIAQLQINEKGYLSLQGEYKKQRIKIESLENEVKILKETTRALKEQNNILTRVMMQWANISSSRDIDIVNIITTGKTRTKVVEQLFEEMFTDDPHRAYKDINNTTPKTSNVTKLDVARKNTIIDDYDL